MVATGYIVEHCVYLAWLLAIFCFNSYYMCLRRGHEKNNELARWFYRLVLALCFVCFAMCYDYRSVYAILPPKAGIWLLATCTNIVFVGISIYLYITLRTLYQTAGKKIGGLADEDSARVRRARTLLIITVILEWCASYARCILLNVLEETRYDSYFLWCLAAAITFVTSVFQYSGRRLSYALRLHGQAFDLTPQLKRLHLIIVVSVVLEIIVVLSCIGAGAYFFVRNKPFGETRPDQYEFTDFLGGVLYFVILMMMTMGVIAPYKGGRTSSDASKSNTDRQNSAIPRVRTVSRFNKPGSTGSATTETNADREISTLDSLVSSPAADLSSPDRERSTQMVPSSSSEAMLTKVQEQYENDHSIQISSIKVERDHS